MHFAVQATILKSGTDLRIAQVAPLCESVPAKLYGGTERVVSYLSISNAQRAPLPWASWAGTVHHGLPLELHRPHYDAGSYLVFLGRIAPGKRVDRAIARRAGLPLKIAARIDMADREYFASAVEPLLGAPGVEYLGEIDERSKARLPGGALAPLFPRYAATPWRITTARSGRTTMP